VGIISVLPNVVPAIRALGHRNGISDRIGAIRYVNIPVLGLEEHDVLVDRLEQQAADVLDKEEADVFVLGCTGMLGVADAFRARLAVRGTPVPVIDPTPAAITWLESATRMGLRPSRTTYMPLPTKDRTP
jgi:allantoin racemase